MKIGFKPKRESHEFSRYNLPSHIQTNVVITRVTDRSTLKYDCMKRDINSKTLLQIIKCRSLILRNCLDRSFASTRVQISAYKMTRLRKGVTLITVSVKSVLSNEQTTYIR